MQNSNRYSYILYMLLIASLVSIGCGEDVHVGSSDDSDEPSVQDGATDSQSEDSNEQVGGWTDLARDIIPTEDDFGFEDDDLEEDPFEETDSSEPDCSAPYSWSQYEGEWNEGQFQECGTEFTCGDDYHRVTCNRDSGECLCRKNARDWATFSYAGICGDEVTHGLRRRLLNEGCDFDYQI